jgi:hypothetical protein
MCHIALHNELGLTTLRSRRRSFPQRQRSSGATKAMPISHKQMSSITGAGVEAQALTTKMLTMQADAGLTIAMRMPMLMKGALGDSKGQREAAKAVSEKMSAVMESGFAASQAAAMFWWGLALNPLAHVDYAEAAAKAASSTLEPFSKRTRANAARLTGRRKR